MPQIKRRSNHPRSVWNTDNAPNNDGGGDDKKEGIALMQRADAYSHFGLISALLVGAALALLIEARNSESRCEWHFVGVMCEMLSSIVLALNLNGLAILCLQDHHVGRLLSTHSHKTAKEAFVATKVMRRRAVNAVAWSMPAMLW